MADLPPYPHHDSWSTLPTPPSAPPPAYGGPPPAPVPTPVGPAGRPRRESPSRGTLMIGGAGLLAIGLGLGAFITNATHGSSSPTGTTTTTGSAHLAVNNATLPSGEAGSAVSVAGALDPAVATIVVSTSVTNPFGGTSNGTAQGSGFVISSSGGTTYLLTNNHVVAGASNVQVILSSGRTLAGTVVGTDAIDDIGVVSVQATGLPQVVFGRSADLKVGQSVVAIGSPLGNQNSVTSGVISALHRSITAGDQGGGSTESLSDVLQTDAPINPGNSGGPLADLAGRVIGVNVATSSGGTAISFAIPSDEAQHVAQDLIAHKTVEHPYLGIAFMTPLDAAEAGRSFSGPGVLVTQVAPGTPAAQAGVQVNDVITAVDGDSLDASLTLGGVIARHHVGESITLSVQRGSQSLTLHATLVQRPSSTS